MTQKQALKLLLKGHNVFLTGAAGSGKTHLLDTFIQQAKALGKEVAITASTGIAATHINGMTIHAWSGIGIKDRLSIRDLKQMKEQANLKLRLLRTQILIIDEVSMISGQLLDLLDSALRFLRNNEEPFGGIQVVLCGDFFQLPPVSKDNTAQFAFESLAWEQANLHMCYLTSAYRHEDPALLDLLQAIRNQDVTEDHFDMLRDRLDIELDDGIHTTYLFAHNAAVDQLNQEYLKRLETSSRQYSMTADGDKYAITRLKKGCLAPEALELKIGAKVMFVKNNYAQGYVNGTVGEVVEFDDGNAPIVQTQNGKEITVQAETWRMEDGEELLGEIAQLPLRLAWAMTIHKSQGMTLDAAYLDLRRCFVEGMGYVALSRVKSLQGLSLRGLNEMTMAVNTKIAEFDKSIRTK